MIMTPSAYMIDDAWLELLSHLCKSIRGINVIKEHQHCWVLLSLGGFGSHVSVKRAHEIFAAHKILVMKEEADTSHVNQAYNQRVAKSEKMYMRSALQAVAPTVGRSMNQWILIAIAIDAQNVIKKEVWIDSFKKVNMHPHTRVSFDKWLEVLDKRGFLSAEQFFDNRNSLYDAMPACWKKLTLDHRQEVIQIIDDVYKSVPANKRYGQKATA